MKGLLVKDFLVLLKLCRSQLIICALFIVFGIFANVPIMLLYVPILLAMMPVNLITNDEVSHWNQYSIALPFTKKNVVSSKYVFSFFVAIICIGFSVVSAAYLGGGINEIMSAAVGACFFSLVTPAAMYPLIYKFGTAKARIGYFIIIGIVAGAVFAILNMVNEEAQFTNLLQSVMKLSPVVIAGCILLYVVSWFGCRAMYEKQDL